MMEQERARRAGIPNREVGEDVAESVLPAPEHGALTAYDFRDELQGMLGWTDDELSALPICYGSEIEAGKVYFDLDHPERGEFRATDQATINPGCRYVAKSRVPESLWYRLATSAGHDETTAGNAAPTPGAFGQPKASQVNASRGEVLGGPGQEVREEQGLD